MNDSGFTAIVAVRKRKTTQVSPERYDICKVPDGRVIEKGNMVFYGSPNSGEFEKGICVSDSLFVDAKTLDMLLMITHSPDQIKEIKAKISVEWISCGNSNDADVSEEVYI